MIIGLIGRRQSGKDTAAAALVEEGFVVVKFADALKEMIRAYLDYCGNSRFTIARLTEGDWKENACSDFEGKSARFAMQTLGTEWGRDMIGESIWVNSCMSRCGLFKHVVISDVRFQNEADAVRKNNGILIRITRGQKQPDTHSSETLMDAIVADFDIENNRSIEDLKLAIKTYIL